MPAIQITLLQGRSIEQKRRIARRVTDVMVEEAGTKPEAVVITFVEVPRENYARNGVLIADERAEKK
jgi:4-oxalocrotonate tautomerase